MDRIPWLKCLFFSFKTLLILLSFLGLAFAAAENPASCHPYQRSALLQLKEGFIDSNLTSWQPGTDYCHGWDGVSCDETTGLVSILDLSSYGIKGNLSEAIFNLTSLEHLNLAYNIFPYNQIPDGFEKLTQLTYLNLSYSGLSGQIPIGIANLTILISLDLSYNWDYCNADNNFDYLRLHKPSLRTLISNLGNLRELHLNYVNISENGTEWCAALSESLPLLRVLSMSRCNLSGPFDPSLSRLHSLTEIDLSVNNFQCSVPNDFSDFPLTYLDLSYSNLTGLFPYKIFQITSLRILDISYNEEVIIASLPNFPRGSSLKGLVLSGTNLLGGIPDSIVNLQNLSYLKLSNCNLSGSIPQSLFALPNLKILVLSKNQFTGSLPQLPQLICKLSNLKILSSRNNQFSGPIPNSIFMLHSLQLLDLSSNKFNGTVKLALLQNLPNLDELYLSDNELSLEDVSNEQLSSIFPKVISFGLASCNLSKIPRLLRYHDGLLDVDLSKNQMHGVIPSWFWKKFASVGIRGSLDLSANKLTGGISSSICDAYLYSLDLSSNNFNNSIPPCLLGAPSLLFLNLATNKFHGVIPNNIQKSCQLGILDLSNNNLHGELPRSLSRCMGLMILNIKNNHIIYVF